MPTRQIVSKEEWTATRKALLDKEKAFDRQRDELSKELRELPWVRVDEDYVFEGSDGEVSLADLFDGRCQLVVQHFMFQTMVTHILNIPVCRHHIGFITRAFLIKDKRDFLGRISKSLGAALILRKAVAKRAPKPDHILS